MGKYIHNQDPIAYGGEKVLNVLDVPLDYSIDMCRLRRFVPFCHSVHTESVHLKAVVRRRIERKCVENDAREEISSVNPRMKFDQVSRRCRSVEVHMGLMAPSS